MINGLKTALNVSRTAAVLFGASYILAKSRTENEYPTPEKPMKLICWGSYACFWEPLKEAKKMETKLQAPTNKG